jgi:hydroxyethylthiazole kinase-like uncharacterized protein yjeF
VRRAYDVDAVRAAERALMATLPEGTLMDRAATALATTCASLLPGVYGSSVVLLVGGGDNGGDTLLAGAALARRGVRVRAVAVTDRLHERGLRELRAAGGRVVDGTVAEDELAQADLVVDGIVGIGGSGALRPDAAALAELAGRSGAVIVAVDVPSGVDASTGEVDGDAVAADVTVTFGALKSGLLVDPGAGHAGSVQLVDIGLDLGDADLEALQSVDVAALLPRASRTDDKYSRGVVGVRAGSASFTGAAALAVGGAIRSGAGMVRYVGPSPAADVVRGRWPEAVVGEGRVQAWVVGPGMDDTTGVADLLERDEPAVVDAGAVGLARGRRAPTLVTPHAGELATVLGVDRSDVEARRLHHARAAAAELGVHVLLKGATTIVAAPDGRARVDPFAVGWLSTAGSGDVLAGMCGALLAAGLDPLDAGSVATFLHGLAGRLACDGDRPVSATEVLEAVPRAITTVRQDR